LKGDVISSYGVFLSSFDGSWANRMVSVFNRLCCMNICGYAMRQKGDNMGIAAKHTQNCDVKLDSLVSTIAIRQAKQEAMFKKLQESKFTLVEMTDFAAKLFPNESTQAANSRSKLIELFSDKRLGQFGETRFDGLNAVTAFVTHESTRKNTSRASADENAFDALVSGNSLTNRAVELLAA
jgi:hypothetical protein